MKNKRMGRTGLQVSEICLGTMTFGWQCDEDTSRAIMDTAFDAGVYFFDTADVYPMGGGLDDTGKSEEIIGRWMAGKRHQMVIATKVRAQMGRGPNDGGLSRRHIFDAIEGSLRRLNTDCIDLYQTHSVDWNTPLEETLRALDDVVRQGKVRYIGCSKYPAWLLAKALWTSDKYNLSRFDCIQPRYNILFREVENEIYPLCKDQGIGIIPFNPLGGGVLTGKYSYDEQRPVGSRFEILHGTNRQTYDKWYWHEDQLSLISNLKDYFAKRGKSMTQVALAWVLANPLITAPIVGASSVEQLQQSLPAVDLTLDEEEMKILDDVWFALPRQRDYEVARGPLRE